MKRMIFISRQYLKVVLLLFVSLLLLISCQSEPEAVQEVPESEDAVVVEDTAVPPTDIPPTPLPEPAPELSSGRFMQPDITPKLFWSSSYRLNCWTGKNTPSGKPAFWICSDTCPL